MRRRGARLLRLLAPLSLSLAAAAPPPSVASLLGLDAREAPLVLPALGCAPPAAQSAACGSLLRARRELREARAAEAAADALRAEREAGDGAVGASLRAEARLVRAEGLARAGRVRDARALFVDLEHAPDPRLRAVAALRQADLDLDDGEAAKAAQSYARALPSALEILGPPAAPWQQRAAEASLRAGDPVGARAWLEAARVGAGDGAAGGLEVRIGDTFLAEGRRSDAENAFRRVVSEGGGSPAARVARLRLDALDLAAASRHAFEAELRAPEPTMAAHAATLLARARLARGDAQGALAVLESQAADRLPSEIDEGFREALAAALRSVVGTPSDDTACLHALARGGGSLVSLARRAGAADVLQHAQACAKRLGLAGRAGDPTAGPPSAEAAWPALAAAERSVLRAQRVLSASGISPTR